jgi:hypothetical protein
MSGVADEFQQHDRDEFICQFEIKRTRGGLKEPRAMKARDERKTQIE